MTNWFTVNATNEAVQQISTGFALAFVDNHLLPSIMTLVRLRWHRLYKLRNRDWKPAYAQHPFTDTTAQVKEGGKAWI